MRVVGVFKPSRAGRHLHSALGPGAGATDGRFRVREYREQGAQAIAGRGLGVFRGG